MQLTATKNMAGYIAGIEQKRQKKKDAKKHIT